MEDGAAKTETQQVLQVLQALKQASHELQTNPSPNSPASNSSSAIKLLLELQTESDSILANDPHLSNLSHHLSNLKTLSYTLQTSNSHHGIRSFLTRRVLTHEISRVAVSIESEIQDWIDRETILNLSRIVEQWLSGSSSPSPHDELIIDTIDQFTNRLTHGFSMILQDLVLKWKVFQKLETILCRTNLSKKVRERAAFALSQLIKFNKDVFVGQVLMGQTVRALTSMVSFTALEVLCSLIKCIKSPLVDDIEANDEIPKIISLLSSQDFVIRVMAMNCVLEIGYFGRKEAIEAMLNAGLIKKVVELQRSEMGGDLIEIGRVEEKREVNVGLCNNGRRKRENHEMRFLESHPFASCVARFAVQIEVGEGLRQREKRAFKQEILKRVREVSVSDADAATIIAEVLWGSSP